MITVIFVCMWSTCTVKLGLWIDEACVQTVAEFRQTARHWPASRCRLQLIHKVYIGSVLGVVSPCCVSRQSTVLSHHNVHTSSAACSHRRAGCRIHVYPQAVSFAAGWMLYGWKTGNSYHTSHLTPHILLSASLYFSKRGAYWDRLCRDVVGWLVVTRVHCGQTVHPRPIVTMEH